jgi:Peptidase family M23
MSWIPAYLQNLATANYGMWNAPDPALHPDGSVTPGEGGVDVGTPNGTPVLAIADGTVIASGYWKDAGHGVVTTRINVPGAGTQDLYYQHIQIDPSLKTGQVVKRGQQIGVIGPYSEIEMGFNAAWGGVWGTNHPGPWVKDPRPWLNAILSGNGAAPTGSGATGGTPSTGSPNPLTDPIGAFWAAAAPTFKQWGEYIAIFLIAIVLLVIGFILLGGGDGVRAAVKGVTS